MKGNKMPLINTEQYFDKNMISAFEFFKDKNINLSLFAFISKIIADGHAESLLVRLGMNIETIGKLNELYAGLYNKEILEIEEFSKQEKIDSLRFEDKLLKVIEIAISYNEKTSQNVHTNEYSLLTCDNFIFFAILKYHDEPIFDPIKSEIAKLMNGGIEEGDSEDKVKNIIFDIFRNPEDFDEGEEELSTNEKISLFEQNKGLLTLFKKYETNDKFNHIYDLKINNLETIRKNLVEKIVRKPIYLSFETEEIKSIFMQKLMHDSSDHEFITINASGLVNAQPNLESMFGVIEKGDSFILVMETEKEDSKLQFVEASKQIFESKINSILKKKNIRTVFLGSKNENPENKNHFYIKEKDIESPSYENFLTKNAIDVCKVHAAKSNCELNIQDIEKVVQALDKEGSFGIYGLIDKTEDLCIDFYKENNYETENFYDFALSKMESITTVFKQENIKNLAENLKKTIFNQDKAIEKVVDSVYVAYSGLKEKNKPYASFMFAGTTGVGKTEMAKQLADNIGFTLLRYDMSEFHSKHTMARFIGAPQGYAGFDAGGMLFNDIEKNPRSVLLFDEIEKADSSIYDIFLQLMDNGQMKNATGKIYDFSQCFIIFTTNEGVKSVTNKKNIGFVKGEENATVFADGNIDETFDMQALKNTFKPEFRNRLDDIIIFNQLTKNIAINIIEKEIGNINSKGKKINISLTDKSKNYIAEKSYSADMGARNIQRYINSNLVSVIAKDYVSRDMSGKINVLIDVNEDKLSFSYE